VQGDERKKKKPQHKTNRTHKKTKTQKKKPCQREKEVPRTLLDKDMQHKFKTAKYIKEEKKEKKATPRITVQVI